MKRILFIFLLSLGAQRTAVAAVIYSGVQDIAIPTTFDGVYVDIDTGATSTSTITGWDINPFFGGYAVANSAAFEPVRADTSNASAVLKLAVGTLVDNLLNYATGEAGSSDHIGAGANQFTSGSEGYLGFKFLNNGNAGPYFGWMRVTFTVNTPGGVIHDWAYDDSGAGILVGSLGAVPEPSRVLLFVLGLAGVFLRRRRVSGMAGGSEVVSPAFP